MDSLTGLTTDARGTEALFDKHRQVRQQVILWRDLAAATREDSQRLRAYAKRLHTRSRAIIAKLSALPITLPR
jgi:hypothetical protein